MIEHIPIDSPWRPKGYSRKHDRGSAPCPRCKEGNHKRCHPHFDNRFCTCSCPIAVEMRAQGAVLAAERPNLSEQELVTELDRLGYVPRTRTVTFAGGDIIFPRIDRQRVDKKP